MKKIALVSMLIALLISTSLWAGTASLSTGGVGGDHTLAVHENGAAYAWGAGRYGRLGDNESQNKSYPVTVYTYGVLSGKTVSAISVGGMHSVALDSEGTVYTWGKNSYGELGNNETTAGYSFPVGVDTSGVMSKKHITAIAAGQYHSVVLASDGTLYSWGRSNRGQLGNQNYADQLAPVEVVMTGVLSGKIITAIAAGYDHTVALASDGTVYVWGDNEYGQLGNNSTHSSSSVPVAVDMSDVLSGKTITAIAAGQYHTVALASDGTVYTWGKSRKGQMGNNTWLPYSSVPVAADISGVLQGKTITSIAAGQYHTVALASDGTIYTWGGNCSGQLGDNTETDSNIPIALDMNGVMSGENITEIAAGRLTTFALASNGKIYSCGFNTSGQLGNATISYNTGTPVQVLDEHRNEFFLCDISPIVTTLAPTDIASDSVIFNGEISELGSSSLIQHGFCWTNDGVPDIEDSKVEMGTVDSTGTYSSVINDLSGSTRYCVRAYVTNDQGTFYGDTLSFMTLDVSPVVATLAPSDLVLNSVTLNGEISELGSTSLIQHGFCWTSDGVPDIEDNKVEMGTVNSTGIYSSVINDLLGSTRYCVRAYVTNAQGTFYGDTLSFMTLETSLSQDIPSNYRLCQNYPNPFNPSTSISYDLAGSQSVSLCIYDLNSRKIVSMNKNQDAGHYEIMFDPTTYGLSTGVYIYRLQAGDFVDTKKMVFMK